MILSLPVTARGLIDGFKGDDHANLHVFPEYPQPYYATFWLDPFGFMLEVVCHYDRD